MGNSFGCTTGEREFKSPRPGKAVDATKKGPNAPLLFDDLEILLEDEPGPPPVPDIGEGASVATFNFNLNLAMRCAVVCMLIALCIIAPPVNKYLNSIPGVTAWMGLVPGGTVLMVVFTVYQNYGTTVQLAYQGFTGTFIACLWAHVMSAIMPYGAYGKDYNERLINTCNVLLIVFTYWLNISKSVRMFIVSYHVFFVMSLQTPTVDPQMNTSWAINWDAQTTTTLGTAAIGLIGALLVVLFPTPIFAKTIARNQAKTAVVQMCDMCDALFDYYMRDSPSVTIAQIETQALALQSAVNGMPDAIAASWWETLDLGVSGKIRVLLTKHADMLATLVDNVFAMQICLAKEDFGDTHVKCMAKIKDKVRDLLDATRELLTKSTAAASDGSIDKDEEKELRACIDKTSATIVALAKGFNATRKQMFPTKVINRDLQAESFFVYCISIYARRVVEYTTQMLDKPQKAPSLIKEILNSGKTIIPTGADIKRSLRPSSFTVRASIEVLTAYYMGLYIFEYNASAACCVSLLLADFPGSAMIKNLGRLQSVVLSAVVPHLITRIEGPSCDPAIACLKAFSVFAWETLMCYIYYSSATYGYIGCLCAAFALGTLIYPCQHETGAQAEVADVAFSFAQYTKILQTTIAVILMMIVDSILSAGRASSQATEQLLRGLMSLDVWFQAVFMSRKETSDIVGAFEGREAYMRDKTFAKEVTKVFNGPRNPSDILKYISMAEKLGAEADKEPRYYRAPWPYAFFDSCTRTGQLLRANLSMVEQVLQGSSSDSLYTDIFDKVRSSGPYQACQNDVVSTLGDAIFMVQEVLHNETALPLQDVSEKAASMEGADKLDDLDAVFDVINKSGWKYPAEKDMTTMEEDIICRVNVILMLMDSSVADVAEMVKACLVVVS